MQSLTTIAKEKSTFIVTVTFTDEDGAAVAPKTLTWSLTDASNNIINSREDVAVSSPAASNKIVLSGDDLQIQSIEDSESYVRRRFVVEATYDSDAGNDLPVKDAASFVMENLFKVT